MKRRNVCAGLFGVFALVGMLWAGDTGFYSIKLKDGTIKDSDGTTRLSIGSTNAITGNVTVSGNTTLSSLQILGVANSGSAYSLTSSSAIPVSSSFVLVTSTGVNIDLASTPTISTASVTSGTMVYIYSTTTTVTLQDNDTLANSALELGSTTRALGVGDILKLIYYNSKWWEIGFFNN